ncbi:MAG: Bax inhibitor-1/YccA family protein [Muribaculaceae bacterium]|nr:Bax inhibitor-1/YccA family protein [Muribaculaceae bacterium]
MDYNIKNVTPPAYGGGVSVQAQTNSVLKRVYLRMTIGLIISAFVALGVASSPSLLYFFYGHSIVYIGMFIVMIAMAWIIPSRLNRMSTGAVLGCFLLFSALMGASLAAVFVAYSMSVITSTFFITAGTFGAMSVYGYFTKRDLSSMGNYLMMALIGLIIASVVNIFWANSTLYWIVTYAGVLIFVALTAWDTQTVKRLAAANLDPQMADKLATMGAMNLYLDFINLFLYILRIVGNRN